MKVTYTGRHIDLSPAQTQKLEAEFEKVGKLLDNGRGEAEAQVILSHERHLNNAEVTVPYHHHELVGQASDADLFTAAPCGGRQARSAGHQSAREMARRLARPQSGERGSEQ